MAEDSKGRGLALANQPAIVEAIDSGDARQLIEQLQACDQLKALDGKRFYCVPLGGMPYVTESVAAWLLERSAGTSADAAIDELGFVALRRSVEVDRVALVYGVTVDGVHDLGHGFSLEPAGVRDSTGLHLPEEATWAKDWRHETLLVRRVRERVKVLGPDENPTNEEVWRHTESRSRELDEALGMISLAIDNGVFHGVTWAEVVGPFWQRHGVGTRTEGQMPAARRTTATDDQIDLARRLLDAFYKLDARKDAVRVALSRYRRACTPWDAKQSAVDIAVAYEGLLVTEKQAEATTLSLCLRGAWFLESDPEARLHVYRMLQSLYGVRSDLVHTGGRSWGLVKSKSGSWSMANVRKTEKLVGEAVRRFGELAQRLVLEGFPASWTHVVLGIPPGVTATERE